MTQSIERGEAHYKIREIPFGRSYEWYPAHVTLVCDCGGTLTLTSISTTNVCQYGAEFGACINDMQEKESHLPDEVTRPWLYEAQERTEQHLRDKAAYPKDSPWRYNDITVAGEE